MRDSYIQDPGARSGKGVSAVDDVAVLGEAGQHVPHALLQRVQLRVDQHLHHQVVRRVLHEALA